MESQQELQEQRRPYICEIVISFPTARHAEQVKQVLEVDREVGAEDRIVHKSFAIQNGGGASPQNNNKNELTVRFAATEAKWLRVSVTSFYDYLIVALKCYQEFDTCDNDNSDNP